MAREGELVKVKQRITAYHVVLARQQVRDPWGRLSRHKYKTRSLWTFLPDFDSIFFLRQQYLYPETWRYGFLERYTQVVKARL